MSALTIGFPLPGSGEPVILIGFDHPIHEHLEACQHWAGTEVTPVAGLAKLEVWTAQGVKSRFSLPENAPVDEQYAHLLEPTKQDSVELLEGLEKAVARIKELEALVEGAQAAAQSSEHFQKLSGEYSEALEKALLRIEAFEADLKKMTEDRDAAAQLVDQLRAQMQAKAAEEAKSAESKATQDELPVLTLPTDGGPATPKKAQKAPKPE